MLFRSKDNTNAYYYLIIMEVHVKFSKSTFSKSNPFSCFLSENFPSMYATEMYLISLFNKSKTLKARYGSLHGLWIHIMALNNSPDGLSLVVLTEDLTLIKFDIKHDCVLLVKVPFAEKMMICNIVLFEDKVIMGCVHQILIINMITKEIFGVDFTNLPEVKSFNGEVSKKMEERKTDGERWNDSERKREKWT